MTSVWTVILYIILFHVREFDLVILRSLSLPGNVQIVIKMLFISSYTIINQGGCMVTQSCLFFRVVCFLSSRRFESNLHHVTRCCLKCCSVTSSEGALQSRGATRGATTEGRNYGSYNRGVQLGELQSRGASGRCNMMQIG